jgi:hypothetical protein
MIVAVVAMPALGLGEEEAARQAPAGFTKAGKKDGPSQKETSVIEDSAYVATSVAVSAGQIPLRGATCAATAIVAGIAYLLTAFDREARQGPADAITQVCSGPYTTSPEELKGH